MNNQTRHKPIASKFSLLRQLCNFIPPHLVPRLARKTGVEDQARTFNPWSHVVSLLYAQLTHSLGLNDVCDALHLHSGSLSALRGATPPHKNTLSHAIFGSRWRLLRNDKAWFNSNSPAQQKLATPSGCSPSPTWRHAHSSLHTFGAAWCRSRYSDVNKTYLFKLAANIF